MKNLIFELARVDRRAALIFNREIKLRIKRGGIRILVFNTHPLASLEFEKEKCPWIN